MLITLFQWLDSHPASYWAGAAVPTLLLLAWAAAAARREIAGRPARPERPAFTALLLLVVLLAWRWPFLFSATEYNPDESQFIAGGITLTHDPVFWRAVDGTSAGPLNFYVLLPLHWLGLPVGYFSARLTGLLLVWGALLACYAALRTGFGAAAARLGVLPAVLFFCLVHEWDFIYYSSEHLPVALTALAAWLIFEGRVPGSRRLALLAAGCLTAGLLAWAKLQAGPLGLTLVAGAAWCAWEPAAGRGRRLALLLGAAALPSGLILILVTGTGQFSRFYHAYVLQNFFYAGSAHSGQTLLMMLRAASATYLLPVLVLGCGTMIAAAGAQLIRRGRRPDLPFLLGGVLTAVAVASVLLPHRGFLHYTLLLVVPAVLWGGAALGGLWTELPAGRFRPALALFALILGAVLPLTVRVLGPGPEMFGRFAADWRQPRSPEGNLLQAWARPGDRLAVWGWSPRLYVETGLPQATNVGYSYWSIVPSDLLDYNRALFLADLERTTPAFFADAVGPEAYYFQQRATEAHESFPALRDHVRRHYVQLADLGHVRLYARRDRLPEIRAHWAELPRLLAAGRPLTPVLPPAEPFPAGRLPERFIGGQSVRMMLPPADVGWPLRGDERAVVFDYGYDPAAYAQPAGNGTEFIVELAVPGRAPQVMWQQLLDPAHQPAQRGRQQARVLLPPLAPGARLTLRTTPGPLNDNAWDWGYAGPVRFVRRPGYLQEQFPGFNRLPAAAEGRAIAPAELEGAGVLMLHAPGLLTYKLHGAEQQVSFAYGFASGAYTNGGRTDGATFTVELVRGAAAPRIIYARRLQPLATAADRGRQLAEVPLPGDRQAGDRLLLRISPGASDAWDWTYVADLFLF